ncbi:MAG: hypothetical protein R2716_06250 [Microthrixaceae bacterium]
MNSRRLGVRAAVVDGSLLEGDVSIRDGRIEAVALAPAPAAGGVAVPGFVDSQVNGFGGVDFRASGPADLGRAADVLAREGVVWAAPTLFDSTEERYCGALAAIGEFRRANPMGGLLGAHLEGPNLAEGCNGARPRELRALRHRPRAAAGLGGTGGDGDARAGAARRDGGDQDLEVARRRGGHRPHGRGCGDLSAGPGRGGIGTHTLLERPQAPGRATRGPPAGPWPPRAWSWASSPTGSTLRPRSSP